MNKVAITIVFAAMLALPSAGATWRSWGNQEPDNNYDNSNFMWFDPPTSGNQVYFNAFMTNGFVAQDSSTTGSRIDNYGVFTFWAILGVWADCNGDGYVGQAETAMLEYPSTVLTAEETAGSAAVAGCADGEAHNNGGWVSELIPIAADGTSSVKHKGPHDFDPRVIVDNTAAVWGDLGLVTAPVRGSCAVTPFEPRTLHSTGGTLDYADCIGAGALANNFDTVAGASGGRVQPVQNPGSKHAWLNSPYDVATFGEDNADNSVVGLSCSGAPLWAPAGSTMNTAYGAAPGAATANTDGEWGQQTGSGHPDFTQQGPHVPSVGAPNTNGNAPGTVNASYEVLTGDCNTQNDQGNDFYSCMTHQVTGNHPCEGQNVGTNAAAKSAADFTFQFSATHRGALPMDPAGGPTGSGVDQVDNAPEDFGIPAVSAVSCTIDCTTDTGGLVIQDHQNVWVSQVQFVSDPRVFNGPRTGPAVGQFRDASFYTFYARVGSNGLTMPPGASGTNVYGAERCPTIGAGQGSPNGWVCDPAHWNVDSTGTQLNQRYTFGTLGFHYQLRDVDCNDGTIARQDDGTPDGQSLPVYAGTGGLAAINCDNSHP